MKIVHLLSQTHLTGAEVYAATLAQAQKLAGHSVHQISNEFFYPTTAICHTLAVETQSKMTFFRNVLRLRHFLKKNNIHILHTHSRAAAKLAYWARFGLKVGMVSTIHGQQHSSISKKAFNQYGDFLLPVCENLEKHLVDDFNYNRARIKVLRNAICQNQFEYHPPKPDGIAKKIAIIGRTTGPKKLRTEQVVKSLLQADQKFEITLVGGRINSLNLSDQEKNQISEVHIPTLTSANYARYDLVVGAGRVCMEALMTGIPTIAFGEATYEGLITPVNFKKALASNFGDIDLRSRGPRLNEAQFKIDIQSVLAKADLEILAKLASEEFSLTELSRKITRFYESAFFLRNYSKWIPILMYHKVPSNEIKTKHRIFVTKINFEKHLRVFRFLGFNTLTFSELAEYRRGEKDFSQFPRKPLILTFDDGYRDNLENASPLLMKYAYRAQLFLLANKAIENNQWDITPTTTTEQAEMAGDHAEPSHEIISGGERQLWLASAFEIGSHGFSHRKVTDMTKDEAYHELRASKQSLEAEFGVSVTTYAFTYGSTNEQAAHLAAQAGYDYAVNTDTGGLLMEEAPYQIFRANIFPEETFFSLWKKTSTWYRKYYFNKRNK